MATVSGNLSRALMALEDMMSARIVGAACVALMVLVTGFMTWSLVSVMILPILGYTMWGVVAAFTWFVLLVLVWWSHMRAMMSDPGFVAAGRDACEGELGVASCSRCNTLRPPRSHHCSTCGRCVMKMDHHCPWINNCVGLFNERFFLLFLFWVFMASMYASVWGFYDLYRVYTQCNVGNDYACAATNHPWVVLTIHIYSSGTFLMFVTFMLFSQLMNIVDDSPYIEKLRRQRLSQPSPTPLSSSDLMRQRLRAWRDFVGPIPLWMALMPFHSNHQRALWIASRHSLKNTVVDV